MRLSVASVEMTIFWVFWGVLGCSGVFWGVLGCLGWWGVLGVLWSWFGEGCDGFAPFFAQIFPCRILRDNQADLLDARPAFELFLSCDGSSDFCVALEVDEFLDLVLRGKTAFVPPCLVLAGTEFDLSRYAYIEFLKGAGEDVHVGLLDHSRLLQGSMENRQQQERNAGVSPLRDGR
jgi:hypothetical protein